MNKVWYVIQWNPQGEHYTSKQDAIDRARYMSEEMPGTVYRVAEVIGDAITEEKRELRTSFTVPK